MRPTTPINRQDQTGGPIRRAHPDGAPALSALAFRSKAHWGYDAAFMEPCREDLSVTADDIATCPVHVHGDSNGTNGFYQLEPHGDEAEMVATFVEPREMGRGIGARLWHHAMATAQRLGFHHLTLQSDPRAEGFHRARGAKRVSDSASTVLPDRTLPLLLVRLR